jgi:hypothetical protein
VYEFVFFGFDSTRRKILYFIKNKKEEFHQEEGHPVAVDLDIQALQQKKTTHCRIRAAGHSQAGGQTLDNEKAIKYTLGYPRR